MRDTVLWRKQGRVIWLLAAAVLVDSVCGRGLVAGSVGRRLAY